MFATLNPVEIAKPQKVALDTPEASAPQPHDASDGIFGTAAECAADALLVKRLSLIVVPLVLLLCLLTLMLSQFAA